MANVEGKNECESEILGGGVEILSKMEMRRLRIERNF